MKHSDHKKPLVLIVDDATKNLQVLGTILKEEPVDIAAAMNGKQALAAAISTGSSDLGAFIVSCSQRVIDRLGLKPIFLIPRARLPVQFWQKIGVRLL